MKRHQHKIKQSTVVRIVWRVLKIWHYTLKKGMQNEIYTTECLNLRSIKQENDKGKCIMQIHKLHVAPKITWVTKSKTKKFRENYHA
jgi:hypothetical protein